MTGTTISFVEKALRKALTEAGISPVFVIEIPQVPPTLNQIRNGNHHVLHQWRDLSYLAFLRSLPSARDGNAMPIIKTPSGSAMLSRMEDAIGRMIPPSILKLSSFPARFGPKKKKAAK
jgi:hypothetical protein